MTPPPKGEARLGSPFGGAGAVRRLRGQPALGAHVRYPLDEHERQRASRLPARSVLNGPHWGPAPPQRGRQDLAFCKLLVAHLLGSPSGGAGTAAAVTERATYQRYHTAHVQGPRSPQKTKDTPFLWRCPFLLGGGAARPPKIKFGGALTTAAEGRMLYT